MSTAGMNHRSVWGRLARLPLKIIPKDARMPVMSGPMRGLRWVVGSHTHGCWLGWYEQENQHHWRRHVKPGMVVYDIGANVGFYTLMASVLVGQTGKVFPFEPLPRNLRFLHEHVRINRLANVQVREEAVSDAPGEAMFEDVPGGAMARLSERGQIKVKLVAVDALVEGGAMPAPKMVKIDVEGAEVSVLRGAERTVRAARPVLFLSTHGESVHAECLAILRGWGYRLASMNAAPLGHTREVLAEPA